MKILGLMSQIEIAGSTYSVTRISRKKVDLSSGRSLLSVKLDEVVDEVGKGNWKVIKI